MWHLKKIMTFSPGTGIYLSKISLHTWLPNNAVSALTYCNALYMGLYLKSIWKVQLVQSAVREVFGAPKIACIILLLNELHWLPVCFWRQFKVLVMTYKAFNDKSPGYLMNCLILLGQACCTHANREDLFHIPLVKDNPILWFPPAFAVIIITFCYPFM